MTQLKFTIAFSALAIAFFACPSPAIDGKHVNGFSVFAQWFWPFDVNDAWTCNRYPRGPIVKATIVDNKAVSWDTLYDSLGQYPAINPTGTMVAFFRWGQRVAFDPKVNDGRISPIAGTSSNPSYLSVVNIDGTGLRNLIRVNLSVDCNWAGEGNDVLDWPVGDWIYYEKPRKTGDIYRIHVNDPTQNVFVTNINTMNAARRWSLSLDGKVAANQGGTANNDVHPFPSDGRTINAPGCNIAVSASGGILAHYYGGCHDDIDIKPFNRSNFTTYCGTWDCDWQLVTIATIEGWLGQDISINHCSDLIRWSVNSDKWVLRQIGWCGQGMAIADGCNQVIVNYKDRTAIVGNPLVRPPKCSDIPATTRGQHINACAGDFYMTGDVSHPNSVPVNSYEDTNGVWHSVNGPVAVENSPFSIETAGPLARLTKHSATWHISLAVPRASVEVIKPNGALMYRFSARQGEDCQIPFMSTMKGMHLVRIKTRNSLGIIKVIL
jgi:hypothetical protein